MSGELKEAEIEYVNYAIAKCPYCQWCHEVSTCDNGDIKCNCGDSFHWSTVN